jgi:iron(II)-dependent oxidoreductase
MIFKFFSRRSSPDTCLANPGPAAAEHCQDAEETAPVEDQLMRAFQLRRFGHIVARRGQWVGYPQAVPVEQAALEAIDEQFRIVPEGFVSIGLTLDNEPGCAEQSFETEPFLLERHAVTNEAFQLFVDGGGYEDLELWPEDMWPNMIDFMDQTDQAAPRFWRDGRHDKKLANYPVVGICYYEAAAYASWAGYRLATEAEWQMAASWSLQNSAQAGRRYPWGDALELEHCNIWACKHGRVLPVNACPGGAAPNGVEQLIGNVWEWTSSDFVTTDDEGRPVIGGETALKSIRGGAFDTYFPWQATSQFRTGLACLSRTHNVGFRCALDLLNSG